MAESEIAELWLMDPTLDGLLGWADQIVLAQKPSPEAADRIRKSGLRLLPRLVAGYRKRMAK